MSQRTILQQGRQQFTLGLMALFGLGFFYTYGPGLPVWMGPWARAAVKAEGRDLFLHEWEANDPLAKGDGLGPVFNAKSCVACHFQGGVGGGGPNSHNVTAFAILPTIRDRKMQQGVVHAMAVKPDYQERNADLKRLFPIIPGSKRVVEGCVISVPDFDPVTTQQINTTALYGAGWIDDISSRSIVNNQTRRVVKNTLQEFALDFDTISTGRAHILPDGRVGKFGWKAQFATLEEFVAAACANEIGLGNPVMAQPRPLNHDTYPNMSPDLDRKQLRALTAYVATLARPIESSPEKLNQVYVAQRGKSLFTSIGCAVCHVPDMGGVEGVYSDFLLHELENPDKAGSYRESPAEVPLPPESPRPAEWRTPPLWGVADSAPYFHDGGSATLRDAILRHHGGALPVTKAFKQLDANDQDAIVTFLGTLKAPPEAEKIARK